MNVDRLTSKILGKISEEVVGQTEPIPVSLLLSIQTIQLGELTSSIRGNRQALLLSNLCNKGFNRKWCCAVANDLNDRMPRQVQHVTVNKPVVGGVNQSIVQVYNYHQGSSRGCRSTSPHSRSN
ncbi:MAG TPA: hypothetical protein V6D50_04065 [Chroococcales cyanobacterium]